MIAIDRLVEVGAIDRRFVAPRRQQRRFVDEVGEVGAGEPGRPRGNDPQVDVLGQLHGLTWMLEDRLAALDVRFVDEHLPVEPAGAEQRGVEHLGPVRRRP